MKEESPKVVRYHFEEGIYASLFVRRGHKYLSLIPMTAFGGAGMKLVRIPLSEEPRLKPVYYKGKLYNYARALKKFRNAYHKFGGSAAVKQALYS